MTHADVLRHRSRRCEVKLPYDLRLFMSVTETWISRYLRVEIRRSRRKLGSTDRHVDRTLGSVVRLDCSKGPENCCEKGALR